MVHFAKYLATSPTWQIDFKQFSILFLFLTSSDEVCNFISHISIGLYSDLQEGVQQLVLGLYIIRGDNMYDMFNNSTLLLSC